MTERAEGGEMGDDRVVRGDGAGQDAALSLSDQRIGEEFSMPTGALHRVVVEFDQGTYFKKLIHPEGGCATADRCGQCGRPFDCDDEEWETCYDCPDDPKAASEECWVQGWFDNLDGSDLLHGSVELTVEPIWEYDHCELHVVGAAMPAKEEAR